MCLDPTLLVSIAFNGLKFVQQQKEDKALQLQQQQQNLIAERNRQAQEAAEFYNIRGKRAATISKGGQVKKEARAARAAAEAAAETVGGKSVNDLMIDFYRQEGEYENSILRNLESEVFASELNLKNIVLQQEGNQTYVQNTQTLPNLAAAGLNYANDYLAFKSDQEMKKILKSQTETYFD